MPFFQCGCFLWLKANAEKNVDTPSSYKNFLSWRMIQVRWPHLHQNKFSACKSADDCKQFFCAFCGCLARIYRNLCRKQRISKLDFRQCVLNKISCFSLFLSHSSPYDWKIHNALESKILQKNTPKYPKSLFLKIENIKVLWKTASENNLKKYDFELNP